MLAFTVQFSNNDQPPITPNQQARVHWGRRLKEEHSLRHPTACPARSADQICVPRPEGQY
ncbi:hypothetical protein SAMN05216532_3870 [Streptomyces sp. 2231.1]|nr:hypothetical protein SAMN05216532_3542 [Streptomyces sp. 2231.1]SED22873.1 hypothetical protein SAMN05216532_3870 [Streptomyces sp. 2231.1]